jgi:ankyrin repeat protein
MAEPHDDRDRPDPDWPLPPEPAMHRAARRGDVDELERLLAAGADVDERGDVEIDNGPHLRGLTPLMVAARSIDGATTDTLRWLVDRGADLHARSEGGNTAAWYAAGHGGRWPFHRRAVTPDHAERLRFLLDAGLDVHECNGIGRSLVTEAAGAGDPARLSLLLERGARATPGSPKSESTCSCFALPIFCAASSGNAECVRLLLDAGVDADERCDSASTPLMHAGSAAVVDTLLGAGAERDAVDEYGDDAFQRALEGRCSFDRCEATLNDVLDALRDAGADVEQRDGDGRSRLTRAAFGGYDAGVLYLLSRAADPAGTEEGSPLHAICWQGEYEDAGTNAACDRIIRALVEAGVDPNTTDRFGDTPLHEAAGGDWGNATAIRTLLELGADPDPVDDDGQTPLMLAAGHGEVACIRLLIAAGASPSARNEQGEDARDAARRNLEDWSSIASDAHEQKRRKGSTSTKGDRARAFGALDEARESLALIEAAAASRT